MLLPTLDPASPPTSFRRMGQPRLVFIELNQIDSVLAAGIIVPRPSELDDTTVRPIWSPTIPLSTISSAPTTTRKERLLSMREIDHEFKIKRKKNEKQRLTDLLTKAFNIASPLEHSGVTVSKTAPSSNDLVFSSTMSASDEKGPSNIPFLTEGKTETRSLNDEKHLAKRSSAMPLTTDTKVTMNGPPPLGPSPENSDNEDDTANKEKKNHSVVCAEITSKRTGTSIRIHRDRIVVTDPRGHSVSLPANVSLSANAPPIIRSITRPVAVKSHVLDNSRSCTSVLPVLDKSRTRAKVVKSRVVSRALEKEPNESPSESTTATVLDESDSSKWMIGWRAKSSADSLRWLCRILQLIDNGSAAVTGESCLPNPPFSMTDSTFLFVSRLRAMALVTVNHRTQHFQNRGQNQYCPANLNCSFTECYYKADPRLPPFMDPTLQHLNSLNRADPFSCQYDKCWNKQPSGKAVGLVKVCPQCLVTSYCSERCFNMDQVAHLKKPSLKGLTVSKCELAQSDSELMIKSLGFESLQLGIPSVLQDKSQLVDAVRRQFIFYGTLPILMISRYIQQRMKEIGTLGKESDALNAPALAGECLLQMHLDEKSSNLDEILTFLSVQCFLESNFDSHVLFYRHISPANDGKDVKLNHSTTTLPADKKDIKTERFVPMVEGLRIVSESTLRFFAGMTETACVLCRCTVPHRSQLVTCPRCGIASACPDCIASVHTIPHCYWVSSRIYYAFAHQVQYFPAFTA